MPPPPDLSAYQLSDGTSGYIFDTQILPAEFKGLTPAVPTSDFGHDSSFDSDPDAKPHAILAVGQTGAGKTRLAPGILEAFRLASRRPAHFIADTYKTYHPEYTRLMLTQPQLASSATGPAARRWLAMASAEAVRRRLDVVLESACRHPDDFTELARIFRDAGYRVDVVVMAVPECLSRLGILTRFYEKLPEAQSGNLPIRLTPRKVHDDSYAGLLGAAKFLDSSGVADHVTVVRREGLVAYSEDKNPEGKMKGAVADALQKERERPLTTHEMKTALDDIQKLSTHNDTEEQVKEVKALLLPLLPDQDQEGDAPMLGGGFTTLRALQVCLDGDIRVPRVR